MKLLKSQLADIVRVLNYYIVITTVSSEYRINQSIWNFLNCLSDTNYC